MVGSACLDRVLALGALFFDFGSKAEDDFSVHLGKVSGVNLPLEGVVLVAVDFGKTKQLVSKS